MSNSTLTRTLDFEPLEDRLLFSASPVDVPEKADSGEHASADTSAHESAAQSNTAESPNGVDANAVNAANTAANTDASNDHPTAVAATVDTDAGEAVTPDIVAAVAAPRHELIVLDLRVENAEAVAENLMANAPEDVKFDVVYLDKATNGLDQILQTLSQSGTGDQRFDAIHLITHADSGRVFVGSTQLTTATLTSDASVQNSLTEWKSYLTEDADVLLYGCDLAAGPAGQSFVNQFAALTGADVAASTNPTGSIAGADWTFEVTSGSIEAAGLTTTLLTELSADPADPVVTVDVVPDGGVDTDTSVMINENFQFTVTFENHGGVGETDGTGYGPFVDVRIAQGIDLNSTTPTYLGAPVQLAGPVATAADLDLSNYAGIAAGYDNSLGAVDVTFKHLYTNATITVLAGTEYYIYDLPFGSFVPDQQPVSLLFTAHTDRTELNLNGIPLTTLPVTATGGFRYGTDPLDNATMGDPVIVGASSTGNITPVVWEVSKDLLEHENETATGPNFPNTWGLFVDVANAEIVSGITLTDTLPAHVIYKPGTLAINDVPQAYVVGTPFIVGGVSYTVTQEPVGGTTHGGQLIITLSQVTGGVGNDVKITYQTYTPQFDASSGDILPAGTGDFNQSTNSVAGSGSWRPDGTGGGAASVPVTDLDTVLGDQAAANNDTLEEQPFAIQKGVTVVADPTPGVTGDVLPGQQLDYSLNFQVSDYFQFQNLYVVDRLGDGQTFFADFASGNFDTRSAIGLSWAEEGVNYSDGGLITGDTNLTNVVSNYGGVTGLYQVNYKNTGGDVLFSAYFYNANSGVTAQGFTDSTAGNLSIVGGETIVVFNLSKLMIEAGGDAALIGGLVGNLSVAQSAYGGTQGTLTYRAKVNENFVNPSLRGGDLSVDIDDALTNNVNLYGTVITWEAGDKNTGLGGNLVNDDSGTTLTVPTASIDKAIYALNEDTGFSGPAAIAAGETITYAVTLTLPTSDIENLKVTDFVPLPRFDAQQLTSLTVMMQSVAGATPTPPVAGTVLLVLADDIYKALFYTDSNSDGVPDTFNPAALTSFQNTALDSASQANVDANSFSINLGSFDVVNSPANLQIKAYFTLTASDTPMADGLFLTNQVAATYNNTSTNSLVGQDIVQVIVEEPVVNIYKGVVDSSKGTTVGSVGGITFTEIAPLDTGISGTLVGDANAALIGALNLTADPLPDAGDKVRFALVVQNTGRAEAYDVTFADTILDSYQSNYADENALIAATNLRVFAGDGTLLVKDTHYTVTWDNGTNTFQISLIDLDTADLDPDIEGALAFGKTTAGADVTSGLNSIIVLYDLTVAAAAQAGSTVTNTAVLTNYSGMDGGIDRTTVDKEESASVEIAAPEITKALIGTEINLAGTGNGATQAVIGELVNYTITITLGEGTTLNARLADLMDSGLAFVGFTGITVDSDLTFTGGLVDAGAMGYLDDLAAILTVGSGGQTFALNFGTILNSDTTDGTAETITISYQAVVLNVAGNQGAAGATPATQLGNTATLNWDWNDDPVNPLPPTPDGSGSISADAAEVTLVEPTVSVSNSLSTNNTSYLDNGVTQVVAGQTIYYKVVITNTSNVWAHDISVYDRLPNVFEIGDTQVLSVVSSLGAGSQFDTNATGGFDNFAIGTDTAFGNNKPALYSTAALASLAPGESITIVVQSQVIENAVAASTHPNGIQVRWTSLDDNVRSSDATDTTPTGISMGGSYTPVTRSTYNTAAVERTGSDGPPTNSPNNTLPLNNYAATDDLTNTVMQVQPIALTKELLNTEIVNTSNANNEAVVGEYVTYRITFAVPKGITENFVLTDTMSAGLAYAELISVTGGADVTTNVDGSGNPTATSISSGNSAADNLTYLNGHTTVTLNGTQVVINLGNLLNDEVPPAPGDYVPPQEIVIIYRALVTNVLTNQSTQALTNSVRIDYLTTNDSVPTPVSATDASPDVTVIEPVLTVDKQITSSGPYDAGDDVTYTIVVGHSGSSETDAYDLSFADALSSQLLAGSDGTAFTTADIGGTAAFDIVIVKNLVGGGTANISGEFEIVGGTLQTKAGANVDLLMGETITITVNAKLAADVSVSLAVGNTASIQWTSMDGAPSTTSSATTDDTERGGSNGAGSGLNNYAGSDSVSLTVDSPTIDKQWQNGDATAANGSTVASSAGNDVVIGEKVTYDILVTLKEGTILNLNVNDVLAAGLRIDSYQIITMTGGASSLVTANFNGTLGGGYTLNSTISGLSLADGQDLSWDFNDVTVDDDNIAGNNSFVIRVIATVTNNFASQQTDTLTNTATLQFGNPNPVGGTTNVVDSTPANNPVATVREATLQVQQSVAVTGAPDAGAELDYTLTVTNNASGQSAYDVTLGSVISEFLDVPTGTLAALNVLYPGLYTIALTGGATATTADFEIAETSPGSGVYVLRTVVGANVDIPDNGSVKIFYRGTVADDVVPGSDIESRAVVRWTSTDGANADERAGGSVLDALAPANAPGNLQFDQNAAPVFPDNYAVSSDLTVTGINDIAIVKALVTTSMNGNDGVATIGEEVTYSLTITLPEGTTPDLQLRDILPPGMAYIPNSVTLNSTGFAGTVGAPVVTPITDASFLNGTDILFDFSSISVDSDNVTTNNTFTITYRAMVLNVGDRTPDGEANDGVGGTTTSLPNSATHNNGSGTTFTAATGTPTITVVEPELSITKDVVVNAGTSGDAGDAVTYTITIQHTGNSKSSAFDLNLTDLLPSQLTGLTLTGATISDGAGGNADRDVMASLLLSGFSLTTVDLDGTDAINLGYQTNVTTSETLVITITGNLINTLNPGTTVINSATVSYTTLPSDGVAGNDYAQQGNLIPDADGGLANGTDQERITTISDDVTITVPATLILTKAVLTTSVGGNDGFATIGETVTYQLGVTVQEGITKVLQLTDDLPAGMQYVAGTAIFRSADGVTAIGVNSGTTYSNGDAIDDDDLTIGAAGGNLLFHFKTVTVSATLGAGDGSFQVDYTTQVLNVSGNQAETSPGRTNSATVSADRNGDGDFDDTVPAETSGPQTATITIVEPDLVIAKTILTPDVTNVDAGDLVTYQIEVKHTAGSNSAAYDLNLTDSMDADLRNYVLVSAQINGVDVAPGTFTLSAGGVLTTTGDVDLGTADILTIVVSGIVKDSDVPGTVLSNSASVTYSSLNGTVAAERTGSGTGPNDYTETASAPVITTVGHLDVVKTVDKPTATIGEVVTYTVTVTVAEGTTTINLDDTLPAGLTMVAGTASLTTPAGWTIGGFSAASVDQTVTVTNPGANNLPGTLDTGTFTYTYQAVVTNVAGNQNAAILTNNLTASADLNNDGDAVDTGETDQTDADVTVVEPRVTIDKAITSSGPYNAGDSITYKITLNNLAANGATSAAYEVQLSDLIPAGLLGTGTFTVTLNTGTALAIQTSAPAFTGGGTGLSGTFDIPVGGIVEITYTAQLQSSVVPGQSFLNNANATFSSLSGTVTGERTGANVADPADNTPPSDNDGTPLNNYAVGDDATTTSAAYAPEVSKAIIGTSEVETTFTTSTGKVLVGEVVTYSLTVDLYEGTLNDFTVFDDLPDGMIFLAGNNVTISYTGSVTGGVAAGTTYIGTGVNFISDSLTGTADGYGNGSGIYFQLGDLVSAGATSVTITFDALVMNVAGNVDGTALSNSFQVFYDADSNSATAPTQVTTLWVDADGDDVRDAGEINKSTSNLVTLDVVEPDLTTPVKALISPVGGIVDAGDTVTYSLAITNDGTAIAHEVVVTDILDDDLTFGAVGTISVTGGGTAPTVVRDGNVFRISDIEVGQTVTFQFTATVKTTVSASELIANSATLTSYSSLPGENGTADATPGDPGDSDGERVYEPDLDSNIVSVTVPGPTLDKVNPVDTDYAIGEIVTWTITVTLPEGVTEDLVITDLIPTGLAFTGYSIPVGTANGIALAPSLSSGGSLGANGANVVLNFGDVTVPVGAAANTFQIQISAVVLNVVGNQAGVTFDNDASLTYTDPDAGLGGTPATASVADSDSSNDGALLIIEPVLTVDKQINGAASVNGLNGGDAVTYTITISNVASANGADAYNVTLADLIPNEIGSLSFTAALNPAGTNTDVTSYFTRTGQSLTTAGTGFTLAEGDVIVITVTGNVVAGQIVPGEVVTNEADIDWSSVAGSVTNASTYLADGTDTERTGAGGVNDYVDSEDAVLTGESYSPLVNKQIIATSEASTTGTNVTIGEVVTYQLKVELYEGTLNNFIIGDVLPPGLQFLAGSNVTIAYTGTIAGGLAAGTYTSTSAAISSSLTANLDVYANGSDVYFKLGDLTNSDNDLDLEFVTITFQAVVMDVAGNTATPTTTLGNSFQVYYDADSNPLTDPSVVTTLRVDADNDGTPETTGQSSSNIVTTTVVEPSLVITKANVSDNPDSIITPGETVQYTVKVENAAGASGATAYDVIIKDTMPASALSGLGIQSVKLYTSAGAPLGTLDPSLGEYTVVASGVTGWTITLPSLAQGQYVEVTYNATFAKTLAANTTIDNNARVFWDSLPADDGNANFGQTDATPDRDYGDSSSVPNEVFNATTTPLQDTERVTVGAGSIGNRVWYDLDSDGVQDANEVSLANVTVTLTGTDPTLGTTYTLTRTTDANGEYLFTGLAPGTYTIAVTLPPGGVITDVLDNAVLNPSPSTNVTITAAETHTDVDFGIRGLGSIGDLVWNNLDGDRVRDLGEPGIDGVLLNLIWDVNGNGIYDAGVDTIISSTTTTTVGGVAGTYHFENLLGGTYGKYLVQTDPSNYGGVLANGSTSTYDKDDYAPILLNGTASVALGVNENATDVDFGFTGPTGSVGDTVWYDVDGDAAMDSNEPGIKGVTVFIDQNSNGVRDVFEAFAITDANGQYLIKGLVDGNYRIVVDAATLPAGAVPTYDFDGLGSPNFANFTIFASGDRRDMDFGYRGNAKLGDRIWNDLDGDGIQDSKEKGIADVKLSLYWDANGNGILDGKEGSKPLLTTTTDSSGNYSFGNLLRTGYLVAVDPTSLPSKFESTFDLDGTDTLHSAGATLATGSRFDADFGYYDPTAISTFQLPPGLFGISYSTLSTYFMMDYDSQFSSLLPEWELVDSTPIFSSPMLSGHAEPGSKVVLSLYNHRGELVSTSTVLVGSGGNWTVGFAGVEVNGPITIESAVSAGDFTAFNGDDNFNFRTNYISGMTGGYFQSRLLGIDDAFSALSYERMAAMEASDGEAETIEGWKKNEYEFLSAPALPGQ